MRLKKINKDVIFKCRFFSAEFITNCTMYGMNWGQFSTGKHKYIHIGRHVLAMHLK